MSVQIPVSETSIPSETSQTSSSHQPDVKVLRAMDREEESTSSPKDLESSTSSGLLGDGSAAPREHERPHAGQRGCGGSPARGRKEGRAEAVRLHPLPVGALPGDIEVATPAPRDDDVCPTEAFLASPVPNVPELTEQEEFEEAI